MKCHLVAFPNDVNERRVSMQAVILAAGMGKRLKALTNNAAKCMVKVNGVTMIERMLSQLDALNLSKIVLVVGYKAELLKAFIADLPIATPIEYVVNDVYDKTNNIYSLYLAKDYLTREDTLLLESDLIFEDAALARVVNDPADSVALVAKYESWMDGTVVTLDANSRIVGFHDKSHFNFQDISSYHKTVNIYKFSQSFSTSQYVPFLEAYIKALGLNEYYEQVLKVLFLLETDAIKAAVLPPDIHWYEIDDVQDLDIAESIFAQNSNDKLSRMEKRYGGYWRYPGLVDFCYLVNPFYPPQRMLDELKANFESVALQYPSGLAVNCLLAAKYFGVRADQIVVGNGAAEIIRSLMYCLEGRIGSVAPTFEEYPNRRTAADFIQMTPKNSDFSYTADDLMTFFADKDIQTLLVINPDNPSGSFIPHADLLRLIDWTRQKGIRLIVDESFVDFADDGERQTLIDAELLDDNRHLLVIKSISKSFGVPGFRLGVLATGDADCLAFLKRDLSIWNINSLGEFFLQIFEKYKSEYWAGIAQFRQTRATFVEQLAALGWLRVLPSQANYVMCEVRGCTAHRLTAELLDGYGVFIKDLSNKKNIDGEFVRIAVRNEDDNRRLLAALRDFACKNGAAT